jgi:hypothetical protein
MENRDRIRLLITDTNAEKQIFNNEEIDEFLAMNGDDVRMAAAEALETIATSEALTLKVIKLLDLSTDGAKLMDTLMKRAEKLREQAESNEEDFDVVPLFQHRRIV